jgi:hypothetical protein
MLRSCEKTGASPAKLRTAASQPPPESRTMPAKPRSPDTPATDTPPRPAARGRSGGWRGRDRLKLLGARRGQGAIVWSGLAIPAAYELDVFASGETHSILGNLEGDFSRLMAEGQERLTQTGGVRLRLDDGYEIAIDLVELEPGFADFSAAPTSADAAALVQG